MNINVLWVDTEQCECHVLRVIERISEMTGATMGGLHLPIRELSHMDMYIYTDIYEYEYEYEYEYVYIYVYI